jgi:hypothetical protein
VTSDMIKGFNRDTGWLATGVLGTVIFAALVLAVQEHNPWKVTPTEEAAQAGSDLLLNARAVTAGSVVGKSSNGKTAPEEGSGTDHEFGKTSPLADPSSQIESAWTATTLVPVLPPLNRNGAQTNFDSGIAASRQDSARAIGPKARNARNRPSVASSYVGVKRRLIELWHQWLERSETRSWTVFSKLNSGLKKKTAYTAATRD